MLVVFVVLILIVATVLTMNSLDSTADEQDTQKKLSLAGMIYSLSYDDIIGFSFPPGAGEIHHKRYIVSEMKLSDMFKNNLSTNHIYFWVVTDLPREDFEIMVSNEGFEKAPNILRTKPDVLDLYEDVTFTYWDIDGDVDEVYFNASSDYEEYCACAFKDGKVYVKKEMTYMQYVNDSNEWTYEKAERRK